jgi:hypothetical protein
MNLKSTVGSHMSVAAPGLRWWEIWNRRPDLTTPAHVALGRSDRRGV